jgi:mannose-6-phosphate isomerase-like protein (cupin superfamily)
MKNLREVADMAPQFGLGEIGEARFPREDLEAETTGLALHTLRPNKRQGFAHRHEQAEEIYLVLSGSGRARLDQETIAVGPMDAIRVAPTVVRAFEAGPDGLELLVFGPRHARDAEMLREDVWGSAAASAA